MAESASYTATKLFDFFSRNGGQTYQGLVAEMRVYNNRADFGGDFAALYNEMWVKWIFQTDADGDGVADAADNCPAERQRRSNQHRLRRVRRRLRPRR